VIAIDLENTRMHKFRVHRSRFRFDLAIRLCCRPYARFGQGPHRSSSFFYLQAKRDQRPHEKECFSSVQSVTSLNRDFFVHSSVELIKHLDIDPNSILKVMKPLYDVLEADNHCFASYHAHHVNMLEMT
jgi:hypothetical protein